MRGGSATSPQTDGPESARLAASVLAGGVMGPAEHPLYESKGAGLGRGGAVSTKSLLAGNTPPCSWRRHRFIVYVSTRRGKKEAHCSEQSTLRLIAADRTRAPNPATLRRVPHGMHGRLFDRPHESTKPHKCSLASTVFAPPNGVLGRSDRQRHAPTTGTTEPYRIRCRLSTATFCVTEPPCRLLFIHAALVRKRNKRLSLNRCTNESELLVSREESPRRIEIDRLGNGEHLK